MDATTVAPNGAVPGQYIVGFKAGTTPRQRAEALRSLAPREVESLDFINGALIKDPTRSIDSFDASPVVEWIQPNMTHQLRDEPAPAGDPDFAKQYHLDNTGQTGGKAGADIKAKAAWQQTKGAGVTVALVDTNIDITHPDIAANAWTNQGEVAGNNIDDDNNGYIDDVHGWNFVNNTNKPEVGTGSHGTHTAGIIAAVANNGVGVSALLLRSSSWHCRFSIRRTPRMPSRHGHTQSRMAQASSRTRGATTPTNQRSQLQ